MPFTGFPAETVTFLTQLSKNNTKQWFDSHRSDYEDYYLEPAKAFVVAAGEAISQFNPNIEAQPKVNGSIWRINRDIRFSADKTPYKDHLDISFWEGERKTAVSGYFFRITPEGIGLGVGAHGFDKQRLAAYREAVVDTRTRNKLIKAAEKTRQAGYPLLGEHYKRLPRGHEDAPEAAHDLLRHNALWVGRDEPHPKTLTTKGIVGWAARRWGKLDPLHRWLVDTLG